AGGRRRRPGGGPPGGRLPGTPPGIPGNPPGLAPPQPGSSLSDLQAIHADVVVEFQKKTKVLSVITARGVKVFPKIVTKWGETGLIKTADIDYAIVSLPTVLDRYHAKRKELLKDAKAEDKADKLIELAKWALGHGLLDEFPKLMDELAKADPKHAAVAAYTKMKAEMDKPITKDDASASWKDKLGNYKTKQTPHYVLIYNSPSGDSEEVVNFTKELEQNYRGFF